MNMQTNDMGNISVEGPSYWGHNTFMELFTKNIPNKEGLKQ